MNHFFSTLSRTASAALKSLFAGLGGGMTFLAAANIPGLSVGARVGLGLGGYLVTYGVQHIWHHAELPPTK